MLTTTMSLPSLYSSIQVVFNDSAWEKIIKTVTFAFVIEFILFMESDIEHDYNKYIIHIVCTDKSFACVFGPNKFFATEAEI